MTAIFDLSPAWQVKDRFQFCAVNDSTAVELQHPRLFFCMENSSFLCMKIIEAAYSAAFTKMITAKILIVDDAPIAEMRWAFLFVVEVVLLAMKRWDFETSTAVIFYNEMLIS